MATYIGIIHKDTGSDYGVSFPDFPGCVSVGRDLDEAARMGKEALELHIQGMIEDGWTTPDPRTLEAAQAHEFAKNALAYILVDVTTPSRRAIRVSITIPEDDLDAIDRYAKNHGMKRSTFLVESAREVIAAHE